jgi:hypothetical protein
MGGAANIGTKADQARFAAVVGHHFTVALDRKK